MGKTIGKVLKVAGATALTVATFNPGFLAVAGISTTALGVVGAASTVAGGLLDPRGTYSTLAEQGRLLQLRTSTTASRPILYGQSATGGNLVYRETTGAENEYLHLVIALAGHRTQSLEAFKFGNESVEFSPAGSALGKYGGFMNLSYHNGEDTQVADISLVSSSSKWTANHKLSGVSYVYLKLLWDHEVFPQGLESTLFTMKGRKLYDPRKDPSNGGEHNGTHSLNDEATWEWSDNPVLAIADYLMGIKVGNKLIAGMGVSPSRIDWANIIAEANICDEQVALKEGGFENRYSLNGWLEPSNEHRDNLKALSSSCGGTVVFQSGKWRCYVAAPRAAIKARCADDVVGSLAMQAKKSTSSKVNSVRGVFSDPSTDYQLKDFHPLQSQIFIDQDGGAELWRDINLPFTKSAAMAQRLAKIALVRSRMERVVTAKFSLGSLEDQAMDVISFSHDRFNLNNQNMLCADWRLAVAQTSSGSEGLAIECSLVEESDEIYSWSSYLDEKLMPQPQGISTSDRRYLEHGKIPGEVNYTTQVLGNVFSDTKITFADTELGFGSPSKPSMNATKGAQVAIDLFDEAGAVLTDNQLKNENTVWADLAGKADVPEAGAQVNPANLAALDAIQDAKLNGIEAGAEVTAGKSLSVLIDRNANNISNTATKRWSTPRRELNVGSSVASNPLSAGDVGSDATISIAAHTVYLGDGSGIGFNSGSITGLNYSTTYYVFALVSTLASEAQTVTYQSTTTKETVTQNDDYYFVGKVSTPAALAVPTTGSGGAGGDLGSL